MEVIAIILSLVLLACIVLGTVTYFKLMSLRQDQYNLYGGWVHVKGYIEANTFINIGSCRHNKSHFAPCGSCGYWHPIKYIRHLYLRYQFDREWNANREQIIQDKSDERQRA